MDNLGTIKLDPSSTERIFNGEQMCFLSRAQIGSVGDLFDIEYNTEHVLFKIIDIWHSPKDFAKKFTWRMCGVQNSDDLDKALGKIEENMIYIHIFYPMKWDKVKELTS